MASWLFSRPALRRHSVRRDVYMEEAKRKVSPASRTRSIAFVGLSMALLAVSAWISIPVGPVPFTLQTFVVVFAFLVLTPRECVAALTGYLALGAIGLPLFSSMRGGIGVLAGPTGGFLWGFLLGAAAAIVLRFALSSAAQRREARNAGSGAGSSKRAMAVDLAAGLLFLAVTYLCGWAQLMAVAGMGPEAAFLTAVGPFIPIDAVKLVAAVLCARAVGSALPRR